MQQDNLSERYVRVQKRIEEIKKFYKHLVFYLIVNFFFIGRRIYNDISLGDSVFEAFTDIDNYGFFFWWGIVLIFHSVKTFGFPNLFNKDWEDRKVKQYLENEENNNKKYGN